MIAKVIGIFFLVFLDQFKLCFGVIEFILVLLVSCIVCKELGHTDFISYHKLTASSEYT